MSQSPKPRTQKFRQPPQFARFANHWGFRIRACRPYRAQTKGKVERPISYVRQSFFYGRDFVSDDDLNAQASAWLQATANRRRHRTTGEAPTLRFERDERHALRPLAATAYRAAQRMQTSPAAGLSPAWPKVQQRSLAVYDLLVEGGA